MLAYVLAIVVVLVAAVLAIFFPALLHLQGGWHLGFVVIVLLLGIAAAILILVLHHRAKKDKQEQGNGGGTPATADLDLALNDANRKLRTSQQGARTLEALPLIYILGDSGTAKTTTVMKSGLDPELLAGNASQDGDQAPTELLNLWFTRLAALLEVGSSVRQSNTLLARLVHRTRAKAYRSAFGTGAAPRAVIVCLSTDQLIAGDAESVLSSARATGAQLREISRLLGMPVPAYVIVTKLDRVPHFAEYVRNLTDAEVRQVLGVPLPRSTASAGTYSEQTSRVLAGVIDALVFNLGEFRVEMLDRENDPASAPGVYEFPRELGKVRKNLNQYLVELCKPSQLSANPYLRGFYFTGVRARTVERMGAAPVMPERVVQQDAGATQYLNLSMGRPLARAAAAAPMMSSARVPQWTFLARLLPEVILGDRSALSATKQSAPARLFRRILYGSLAFLFLLWIICLVVSYINNAALERRIQNAARTLPTASPTAISLPSTSDLNALDDLRQTILQLDDFQKNGIPWRYRWGLYQGDKLSVEARRIYFDRFRPMMLNPTQANFLAYMRGLPDAPATSSDFSSYNNAYNPLKAYLITTSNPDKSQPKFLTPVFYQYWAGSRQIDADQPPLAQKQIDFYGNELLRQPPPYAINPDTLVVEHTRSYLSRFLGAARVYQAMLTDADRTSPAIDFNRQYPGSADFVVDSHVVRGAFSKAGFAFMQDAVQHPDKYASGEKWVLGDRGGQALNSAVSSSDLSAQYTADFLKEWRSYLASARVVNCTDLKDASSRLSKLTEPASPLLQLFYLVSHNTAVNDPEIKRVFQPAQTFVDPNATDRLIGDGNQAYVTALANLGGAIDLATATTPVITESAAFMPIATQVNAAYSAVQRVQQGFNVDAQGHSERTVVDLLKQPIDCVDRSRPTPEGAGNKAGGKICETVAPLIGKFPFSNNQNAQASLAQVDAALAPGTGVLWSQYTALQPFFVQQGAQYVAAPGAPAPVNPKFLAFFNRAVHASTELYQPGAKVAAFAFDLRFIPGGGVSSATFVVDGQQMPPGTTTQRFTWNGTSAQSASLIFDGNSALQYPGTWSLFQLVRKAAITHTAGGYRLDYKISNTTTIQGQVVTQGGPTRTVTFELSGTGADLLVGDGLNGLSCPAPAILPPTP